MLVKTHLFKRMQIKLKFIFIQCIIKQPLKVFKKNIEELGKGSNILITQRKFDSF